MDIPIEYARTRNNSAETFNNRNLNSASACLFEANILWRRSLFTDSKVVLQVVITVDGRGLLLTRAILSK